MTTTASPLAGVLLLVSVLLSVAFFVYGLNTLHLTIRSRRYRPVQTRAMPTRPAVAIQLPVYNELYVVGRLIDSCARLADSYGKDLVRICVLDDSTDETSLEVDRLVSSYGPRGYRFTVQRRGTRGGFKAGALQAALESTDEKYVAVFDADFVPPPDFLDRTVPVLEADPEVGFVQAKWAHIDREYSSITKAMAIGVDAHFLLEQAGRNGSGYLMNFNGSAGVLRVKALRDAGGWSPDTLAEDLDASYRVQLKGYRGVYLKDLEVPGELPPTVASLKRQQGRWARGSLQTARKLATSVARSDRLSIGQKVEAGIHLTYYLVHPLMVASFLLAVVADFLSIDVIRYAVSFSIPTPTAGGGLYVVRMISIQVVPWAVFSTLVILSTMAVLLTCVQAVRAQRMGLLENIKQVVMLVFLGYGISVSNSVHALEGLLSTGTGVFSRTPKYAIEHSGQTWRGKNYQLAFSRTTLLEAGAVALSALALVYAVHTSNLGILPILAVYFIGYSFVLYLTVKQRIGSAGRVDG